MYATTILSLHAKSGCVSRQRLHASQLAGLHVHFFLQTELPCIGLATLVSSSRHHLNG